jgi:hypothetical protein
MRRVSIVAVFADTPEMRSAVQGGKLALQPYEGMAGFGSRPGRLFS